MTVNSALLQPKPASRWSRPPDPFVAHASRIGHRIGLSTDANLRHGISSARHTRTLRLGHRSKDRGRRACRQPGEPWVTQQEPESNWLRSGHQARVTHQVPTLQPEDIRRDLPRGLASAFCHVALGLVLSQPVPLLQVNDGEIEGSREAAHRLATQKDRIVGSNIGQSPELRRTRWPRWAY